MKHQMFIYDIAGGGGGGGGGLLGRFQQVNVCSPSHSPALQDSKPFYIYGVAYFEHLEHP